MDAEQQLQRHQQQHQQQEELLADSKAHAAELSTKLALMSEREVQMRTQIQQLDAQVQGLHASKRGDEAQLARASQTIRSLEEKIQLSSAEHVQLCDKHDALKQRFKLDIETVQKGAALDLERCRQEADDAALHLRAQIQELKMDAEQQLQRHQQQHQQQEELLADSKAHAAELSTKLALMDRDSRQLEAQVASQSSTIDSSRQSVALLQAHLQVVEKSLGEARASSSSLHTENARLNAELLLSQEALDASHSRERQLIVQLETSHNNGIAETAARASVAAEQYRLSQLQVEALQSHASDVQSQLREARRSADAASAAERDAVTLLSNANAEISKLRQQVRELSEAAKETDDRLRAAQSEADSNRQQLLDLVRLCKQQERAHAALKASLQVVCLPGAASNYFLLVHHCRIAHASSSSAAQRVMARLALGNFIARSVAFTHIRRCALFYAM